jgi:exonuclease VII large subunit
MTCEECGDTGNLESNCPKTQEDVNYINNNSYRTQQNQGWNQQQRPNYQGNYQGNFQGNNYNNFNQPPLRELFAIQSKLMDQMSKKIVSNDKILENISTRMDTFASSIRNQHSSNKMIESQIAQLATVVPPSDKGKIPR